MESRLNLIARLMFKDYPVILNPINHGSDICSTSKNGTPAT
ncbi:MAG: hypothetical protein JWR12_608 [Mucilaginibacter sp.]|nr:hypothetical protein [Mucilaginibacter sp.]